MPLAYFYTYIALTIASLGISVYILSRLWRIRKSPGATSLMWTIHCILVWSVAYVFEVSLPTQPLKYIALKAEYLGIPFISLAVFTFAMVFTGRNKWLRRDHFALLSIIPMITFALAHTNQWHGLLWSAVEMPAGGALGALVLGHGGWYNINVYYSYGLLVATALLFLDVAIRGHRLYRTQAIIMLAGMLLSWSGNVAYVFDLLPGPNQDWTPLTFTLGAVALAIGFSRYKLVDVLPIAYGSVFAAMSDGVVVTDLRGRIVEMNPAAEHIYQKTSDELIGNPIQPLLPAWVDWRTDATGTFQINHEISLGKNAAKRTYSLRIAPILGQRGRPTGQIVLLSDITVQKKAQAQVVLQIVALEAAQNGIVITNAEGEIEWANPAFSTLTGYSIEEALGKKASLLKSGRMSPEFYQKLWKTIATGNVWRGELVNRRKDGSHYDEEMTITPMVQRDGIISHYIAIKQDISKRKEAEAALQRAHQEAVEANRLKTQLLANVSHDLRTPLGAVIGYAEMLQTGAFGKMQDEQVQAANEILDSANQLLRFINNLIGQAQLETGKVILHDRPFEPAMLIETIRASVSYHAAKKGLNLSFEVDPALPTELIGDDYWLQQILLNLVNNAIKFTDKGGVTVRLFPRDEERWVVQVQDTGIGIPEEYREKIFSAFEQVDGTRTRKGGGSGLGLSIVKQLADMMKGQIELESQAAEGSTFTIILPMRLPMPENKS